MKLYAIAVAVAFLSCAHLPVTNRATGASVAAGRDGVMAPDIAIPKLPSDKICRTSPCVAEASIRGVITPESATAFEAAMKEAGEVIRPDRLIILLASTGGDMAAARRMRAAIAASKIPVKCHALVAASAAFWVLQACPNRTADPGAVLMIHAVKVTMSGRQYGVEELQDTVDNLKMLTAEMWDSIAERSGVPKSIIGGFVGVGVAAGKDGWWIPSAEAKGLNLIDAVVVNPRGGP